MGRDAGISFRRDPPVRLRSNGHSWYYCICETCQPLRDAEEAAKREKEEAKAAAKALHDKCRNDEDQTFKYGLLYMAFGFFMLLLDTLIDDPGTFIWNVVFFCLFCLGTVSFAISPLMNTPQRYERLRYKAAEREMAELKRAAIAKAEKLAKERQ